MMQAVKDGKASIKEILLKGIELNSLESIVEKVGMMEQVLIKHFHPSEFTLSYLKDTHLQLDILPSNKTNFDLL